MPTMAAAPLVSVTICMRNGGRYIHDTLHSVFAQTLQDFEIILVDDGSTDGSVEAVARDFPDPRLRIVRQRGQTLRVARPVALAHCTGEFITFVDHDDLWLPHKLETQVALARQHPAVGLVCSDCFVIDAEGRETGRLSDDWQAGELDLRAPDGHLALLRHGNFVAYPSAFARASAVRAVGGFSNAYQYVSDYDLWLRIARRHDLAYITEPLAKYRVHGTQMTQRSREITVAEHGLLFGQITSSASYPFEIRNVVADNLFGQRRLAVAALWAQGKYRDAAVSALRLCTTPLRLQYSLRHRLRGSATGAVLEKMVEATTVAGRIGAAAWRGGKLWSRRAVRLVTEPAALWRSLVGTATHGRHIEPERHVWMDGTPLGAGQTGYFHLVAESIRRLTRVTHPRTVVHVVTTSGGRTALKSRLGADAGHIRFHRAGWRAFHWSQVHDVGFGRPAQLFLLSVSVLLQILDQPAATVTTLLLLWCVLGDELVTRVASARDQPRLRWTARLVRYLWRRFPAPRGQAPHSDTTEVVVWRGRFRWRDSRHIAVIQDLTTRILPEMHTPGNVSEFEEFLGYARRHATDVVTVSEHSRQDIIDRIGINPACIRVTPMPMHPQYEAPVFNSAALGLLGIRGPYVLCVGAIEPRKNLRRLVTAFGALLRSGEARGHRLVLAGPQAWDPDFRAWLVTSDAYPHVHMLGYVPLDHLPALYHHASAVIMPSVYEGFGIPMMEAMCCSAVVLASNVSSLPGVLGDAGLLFDPYDTGDITNTIRTILALTPAEAQEWRTRSRRRADAHFAQLAAAPPL